MNDQAENLRLRVQSGESLPNTRTLAVISGKGGVGKSNFSLNFSISLSKQGKSVLLFDMDIGMGNIDILLGNTARRTIVDFFQKGISLQAVISKGPENISFISGGTGLTNLFSMNEEQFDHFLSEFSIVQKEFDYIIFDLGAGISQDSSRFLMCVDEIITITTPEPTSIMDAYSIIKYLHFQNKQQPVFLVCNRVLNEKQGKETISRLQQTLKRFIGKELIPLGALPDSKTVLKAVTVQTPFTVLSPNADISIAIQRLTANYLSNSFNDETLQTKTSFLIKLKSFFKK